MRPWRHRLPGAAGLLLALVLAAGAAACTSDLELDPTPIPTTFPTQPPEAAAQRAADFLAAWAADDYAAMHALLAQADRERYPLERFTALHAGFSDMLRVTGLTASSDEPRLVALPPQPRPPDLPAPTPTPMPTIDPSASPDPSGSPSPSPSQPPVDPTQPLAGPVPGLAVPVELAFATDRFGALELDRSIALTHGLNGWQVRWSPALLFPELGAAGSLQLDRELGPRGDVVAVDGTVFATTREDGVRVYPQEALAGQVIGYLSEVTAEDLQTLAVEGYAAGDVVGRSGLEGGGEALLRGTPGWTLSAIGDDGTRSVLYETEMVPGATLTITLRPSIQLAAQQALAPYASAATAAVDPTTGDVWALASAPAFNPNAMTLGTTLAGEPLPEAGFAQIFNKAVLGAYPAGSSFKPFTLAAALQTGVATPQTGVTCPPTWQFSSDFTVRNYLDHSLPGTVSLAETMAFSCNTTYMPLALEVYRADPTALTDLLAEFGFGQATGIGYVIEETGILPDDAWLRANRDATYGPFDQMQMAIGQGAFLGTPLQLANAFAAIGNGGTRWVPRIVVSATLPDGTVIEEVAPTVAQEISMDSADLAYVTDTLEAVNTLPYGTGTNAFAGFGIPVAGKTGTAETGGPDPHAWYPAYAPADAPTISVATVLPNIRLGTGGTDAAPLVRRVMAAHFAE
ncbi:MAG: penicillin-binding transpeptidase domain-containing protein [Candidatus Limnocylindria bacterium]